MSTWCPENAHQTQIHSHMRGIQTVSGLMVSVNGLTIPPLIKDPNEVSKGEIEPQGSNGAY